MGNDYHRAYVAYMEITRGGAFINNEGCVKDTINRAYWKSRAFLDKPEPKDNTVKFIILEAAIAVILLAAVVIFIIYVVRRKSETADIEIEEPLTLDEGPINEKYQPEADKK
eukprot:TRINITY_DN3633_c0_g2_i14.p1 TRINITY_DN3633_c0_g2~~TRINITY_DN3633_c0_g2_i14.p1  ORF type:complete len:112 (-),score=31.75 TRINITY_DN3633_c0_g2_i14:89-424(-)